jgi:DNA-binding MarR family transcriptional regulator
MVRPSNQIGYLLQHISSLLAKQTDQVLQEQLGIGFSQFKILRTLQTSPKVKQQQIASNLGQTEASISRQVKLMMQMGLLESRRNPKNGREHLTVATAKGERVSDAAVEVLGKYYAPTFEKLGTKRSEQLLTSLTELHDLLCTQPHMDPVNKRP